MRRRPIAKIFCYRPPQSDSWEPSKTLYSLPSKKTASTHLLTSLTIAHPAPRSSRRTGRPRHAGPLAPRSKAQALHHRAGAIAPPKHAVHAVVAGPRSLRLIGFNEADDATAWVLPRWESFRGWVAPSAYASEATDSGSAWA